MKKAAADWMAELWVECPYCEEYQQIDFMAIDEWRGELGGLCTSTSDLDYEQSHLQSIT